MGGKKPDYILITISVILGILGILIIYSVSAPFSQERFGHTFYYLKRQLLFGFIPGAVLCFILSMLPLRFLKRLISPLFLLSLILLVLVFVPRVGVSIGGATRWIAIGPISFQPSELLKLTFILYLAAWLTKEGIFTERKGKNQSWMTNKISLIAFFIIIGLISLFLLSQPDFSTLGLIIAIAILMYFSARTPFWYTIIIVAIIAGGLFVLMRLAPYRLERLLVFLNPEIDPMGIGYQSKQALITVGSGGISGLGLGMSLQKFGFLPHPIADSIFAIFAEETGFIGSFILILLFLIFLWRGYMISKKSSDKFSQLITLGISSWIVLQSFLHIGSMIGILPLTGIPLPFISYGASHLTMELAGLGILLNISKQ
jgi:cell division protein FtsW